MRKATGPTRGSGFEPVGVLVKLTKSGYLHKKTPPSIVLLAGGSLTVVTPPRNFSRMSFGPQACLKCGPTQTRHAWPSC